MYEIDEYFEMNFSSIKNYWNPNSDKNETIIAQYVFKTSFFRGVPVNVLQESFTKNTLRTDFRKCQLHKDK